MRVYMHLPRTCPCKRANSLTWCLARQRRRRRWRHAARDAHDVHDAQSRSLRRRRRRHLAHRRRHHLAHRCYRRRYTHTPTSSSTPFSFHSGNTRYTHT